MSYKSSNGIKLTKCDSQQWKQTAAAAAAVALDTSVKLAGEEAKDRLYEPKHKKKLVRVLTVIAYVFFVSLAAIMLSLYYVFLWNGNQKVAAKYVTYQNRMQAKCDIIAEMQQQITAAETENISNSPAKITEETTTTWGDYDINPEFGNTKKRNTLIQKLINYKYPYAEND